MDAKAAGRLSRWLLVLTHPALLWRTRPATCRSAETRPCSCSHLINARHERASTVSSPAMTVMSCQLRLVRHASPHELHSHLHGTTSAVERQTLRNVRRHKRQRWSFPAIRAARGRAELSALVREHLHLIPFRGEGTCAGLPDARQERVNPGNRRHRCRHLVTLVGARGVKNAIALLHSAPRFVT